MAEYPPLSIIDGLIASSARAAELSISPIFANRYDGGAALQPLLAQHGIDRSWVTVAIPRGGIPVASVAMPDSSIQLAYARKIPLTSSDTRYGSGAVGPDGNILINWQLLGTLDLDQAPSNMAIEKVRQTIDELAHSIGQGRIPDELVNGKRLAVIDDAIASGFTMEAVCRFLAQAGAKEIAIISPVAHQPGLDHLKRSGFTDQIIFHTVPPDMPFLGDAFYQHFEEPTPKEIRDILHL